MTHIFKAFYEQFLRGFGSASKRGFRIPIATRLILSFLLIIVIISATFTIVGIQLISDRIVTEAQEKVHHDLNSPREIYLSKLKPQLTMWFG